MKTLPLALRFLLSATYVAMGVYVLAKQPLPAAVFNWIFGAACIVYGVFRGVRAYQSFCQEEESDE